MIYIVRHGQTDWNIENRFQGQADINVNDKGIKQANKTKECLKDIIFDKVYSSPLKRALTTTKIITNKDIIIDNRIAERYNGELEGKDKSLYKSKINFYLLEENEYGVEPFTDYKNRIYEFFDDLLKDYSGENILVVTHSIVSVMIRCYFEGEPKNGDYDSYKLGNAEIIKYNGKNIKN